MEPENEYPTEYECVTALKQMRNNIIVQNNT